MTDLVVSEVFGPTFQGEGPSVGTRAGFVRLGRCNLDCAWCDTPYTWDWKGKLGVVYDPKVELAHMTVTGVAARLVEMAVPLVVVTGGEPLLQSEGVVALTQECLTYGLECEIETNGTRPPPAHLHPNVRVNVSPKLPSAHTAPPRYNVLAQWRNRNRTVFKLVVANDEDLRAAHTLVEDLDLPLRRVWLMPEGGDVATYTEHAVWLAPYALGWGVNLTPRFHLELFGGGRGW